MWLANGDPQAQKPLSNSWQSSSFQKIAIYGPAPIDGLLWTIVKSVHSSL